MITVYDKKTKKGNFDHNGLAVLDECIAAEITEELNGDYSLELEYPVVSRKAQYLEEFNIIKANGQLFRIYKVESIQEKVSKLKVWARHIFYDLAYYFIESVRILNANTKEALQGTIPPELQAVYDFTAPEENIAPFAAKEINVADAMFRLIGVYGGEIKRDNYKAHILEKVGAERGVLIKYGKNIKGMKVIEDTSEIATRIYPVGASGLLLPERYIEVEGTSGDILAFPITKKVEFKDCKDVESLRAKAMDYAKTSAQPKLFITIDFLELSKTEEYKGFLELTVVEVGDIVTVKHEKLGTCTNLRVIKKKIDLINPINTKIELGDPLNTIIEKLDTSKLLEEINSAIVGTLSSVIIKKNSDVINIATSNYPAMIVGISAKADTNLNCNISMTGKASEDCSIELLFSLDGKYYDFKPVQKLAAGNNVIGLPLPMPQVTAGNHTFMVEMKVTAGKFTIEKNNLQISIEGRDLEGGLSASIPRAEVVYTFLFNLFRLKIDAFGVMTSQLFEQICHIDMDGYERQTYSEFSEQFLKGIQTSGIGSLTLENMGIIETFSERTQSNYLYDHLFINWNSDFDKKPDGSYDYYSRAAIKEPILESTGGFVENLGSGALYSLTLPSKALYKDLVAIRATIDEI
ncbi:phage tail spike protein [Clostridium thermarum]|uniref:phage tail spike protein n=1 Tax=Clostridium thermarum TaxID=1716543 RepID=UPI00112064C9|nr:phage tail spike protein [Clostridium thermarum]